MQHADDPALGRTHAADSVSNRNGIAGVPGRVFEGDDWIALWA